MVELFECKGLRVCFKLDWKVIKKLNFRVQLRSPATDLNWLIVNGSLILMKMRQHIDKTHQKRGCNNNKKCNK